MKSEEQIKEELQYQIKQGFLDHTLNVETNPRRIDFINGYISALQWTLDNESEEE